MGRSKGCLIGKRFAGENEVVRRDHREGDFLKFIFIEILYIYM